MGRLFEPVPDLEPGERFAMLREVFYLELTVRPKNARLSK